MRLYKLNFKIQLLKLMIVFSGTALMAVGVILFVLSGQGVDPLSTMLAGFTEHLPIELGTLITLFNVSVLGVVALIDRRYIGVGSLINAAFVGIFMNLWMSFFEPMSQLPPFLLVALAIFVFTFGIAVYMSANLGLGPVEAMMNVLADYTPLDISKSRTILDISYIVIGIILGATYGYGTILSAILISPMIGFFMNSIGSLKQIEFIRLGLNNVLS